MFERYSESARRALFFARYETTALGGDQIETGHLLLGLLRSAGGITERLFARADLTCGDVRREIETRSTSLPKHDTSVEYPRSVSSSNR